MPRLPAEERAGASDVQLEVIIREIDHPRLDEGVLKGHRVFEPRTGLREWLRDLPRLPFLVVNEPAEHSLEGVVAQRLRFAEEQCRRPRQLVSALDREEQRLDEI